VRRGLRDVGRAGAGRPHRLGLTPGQPDIALFGLAVGSAIALAGSGALITRVGSRPGPNPSPREQ
jgi:hypothetical protein